jgi:L-ascorbate metabolism protein UlaG (beta-lactamase superfamily)
MIRLYGHSMLVVNGELVIDPHDGGSIGLPPPEIERVKYVLITHDHYDHNAYQGLISEEVKMSLEGEFAFDGYKVRATKVNHDREGGKRRGKTSMYEIKYKGITLLHMGDVGEIPRESILKSFSPDVLAIPVGGLVTIDGKEAAELVKILNPDIVIPLHYWVKGLLLPLDPPDQFLHEINYQQIKGKEIDENNLKKYIFLL